MKAAFKPHEVKPAQTMPEAGPCFLKMVFLSMGIDLMSVPKILSLFVVEGLLNGDQLFIISKKTKLSASF